MQIETITRYSFIGDAAEKHAIQQRKKAVQKYGPLVSELIYYPAGRVGFEITIQAY